MKILWIADLSLDQNPGGAQRSDDILIKYGRSIGHEIVELNYGDVFNVESGYDYIITGNVYSFCKGVSNFLPWINHQKNHIRLEHDSNLYLTEDERQLLFGNCVKTIFLSKTHHYLFSQYKNTYNNIYIVEDPIDTKSFYDYGQDREDAILYAGFLHPLKGFESLCQKIESNPSLKFVVAGFGDDNIIDRLVNHKNVEYFGLVQYDDMPKIYNFYTDFFYYPNIPEPFCRSVAEAILCGMNVEIKGLIGSAQLYNEVGLEVFRVLCQDAPERFWDIVENG